jgi:hypothetical protein
MDINLTKKLDTLKQHRKEYNIAQDKLVKSQNSFREDYIPFLLSSIKVTEWTTRFTKNKEGVLLEPVDNKRIEELKYPLLGIVDTEKGYRLPNYPIFLVTDVIRRRENCFGLQFFVTENNVAIAQTY